MMIPTVSDVVRSIADSVDQILVPGLQTLHQRSTALTIGHMLRYVEHAVDMEGPLLFEEANRLRELLGEISGEIGARDDDFGRIAAAMADAAAGSRDPDVYPSVSLLAAEVREMTQLVDDLLVAIHAVPESERDDAVQAVHGKARQYITWQLEQEARMIEPPFVGHGARR